MVMPYRAENEPRATMNRSWSRNWLFGNAGSPFIETLKVRALIEIGCAFAAASLVSPLVGIIDKSIVQNISGGAKFLKAASYSTGELLFTPNAFFRSPAFRLTFGVYFGTFSVANLSEAFMDARKVRGNRSRKQIKLAAASAANTSLLAWRDSVFARQFAFPRTVSSGVRPSTPFRSLALFAARDAATMYATFYTAPRAAQYLVREHGVERNTAALSMALAMPMATQFITAPFHIHAIDVCQNPRRTLNERLQVIRSQFSTVALARSFRILPAFGLGSFSNNQLREWFIRQHNEDLLLRQRITNFFTKRPTNLDYRGRVLRL